MTQTTIFRSHQTEINLSDSLYNALQRRCSETGESVDHIVQSALAKMFGIEHHTLYQVSTISALVQGVYQGCVNVGAIKTHGNFGLGTYDDLNGEGLMLDGRVYQALGDVSVKVPPDNMPAPFWVATDFIPDRTATLASVASWADLCAQIDKSRNSENSICRDPY